MPVQIASTEDVYLRLYGKLIKDWIVISGDPGAIISLEYAIYTPGTSKNADIELIMLKVSPLGLRSIFIGRKRPELRNMLKLGDDLEGWKSLYFLSLKPFGKLMALETMHLNPEVDKEHFMEDYVRKILGMPVEEDPQ